MYRGITRNVIVDVARAAFRGLSCIAGRGKRAGADSPGTRQDTADADL